MILSLLLLLIYNIITNIISVELMIFPNKKKNPSSRKMSPPGIKSNQSRIKITAKKKNL